MSERPHPSLGELVDPQESYAFVALVELMDSLGCRFVVKSSDDLGTAGPELPPWCITVATEWFDFIVAAHAGIATGHHLYTCTECCFSMLLVSARKGRRCPACGAAAAMTHKLPIHFADPPARRKPAPKRPREVEPSVPADDPPTPKPPAWPNCTHSLTSVQPDGTTRCSYCTQEVTP